MNFSVVIPLYNKGKYIKRAIQSVLDQTIQDFELIIVDDGSTDNSVSVVNTFSDERIVLIQQANSGVSVARNIGINSSKYEYIAFLDADDEWKPDFLETISKLILLYPDVGAYATGREYHRASRGVENVKLEDLEYDWKGIVQPYFKFVMEKGASPQSSSSVVVPKKVFDEVGFFPVGESLREDADLWVRIALKYKVVFDYKICVRIYMNTENNSNKVVRNKRYVDGSRVVETLKKAIDENLIPKEDLEYAKMFLEISILGYAVILIRSGDSKEGRKVLRGMKHKYYWKKALMWYTLSIFSADTIEKLIFRKHGK